MNEEEILRIRSIQINQYQQINNTARICDLR